MAKGQKPYTSNATASEAVTPKATRGTCSGCRHYESKGLRGQCRRYPPCGPVANTTNDGPILALPVMRPDDWCGEFSAI